MVTEMKIKKFLSEAGSLVLFIAFVSFFSFVGFVMVVKAIVWVSGDRVVVTLHDDNALPECKPAAEAPADESMLVPLGQEK